MLKDLSLKLHSLTVFRNLLDDDVIGNLLSFLDVADGENAELSIDFYSGFVKALYESGFESLSSYISELASSDENVYIRYKTAAKPLPEAIEESTEKELLILQEVCDLTSDKLRSLISYEGYLPSFKEEKLDLADIYAHRMENIHKYGYGMYAKYRMFYLSEGRIVPVVNPDRTTLSELIDYKREQKIILDNTNALLSGKPASNILLTGDAGTGKSSTIKAIVNELYSKGLRILEVRKEQLRELPKILDELTDNPLKFIVFIDDLSFPKDDDNFSALERHEPPLRELVDAGLLRPGDLLDPVDPDWVVDAVITDDGTVLIDGEHEFDALDDAARFLDVHNISGLEFWALEVDEGLTPLTDVAEELGDQAV